MKRKALTPEQFAAKMTKIKEVEPDRTDIAMMKECEEINDGETIELDALKQSFERYSGSVSLRMPRSMHKELSQAAKAEGVSLNQYILYCINKGNSHHHIE